MFVWSVLFSMNMLILFCPRSRQSTLRFFPSISMFSVSPIPNFAAKLLADSNICEESMAYSIIFAESSMSTVALDSLFRI